MRDPNNGVKRICKHRIRFVLGLCVFVCHLAAQGHVTQQKALVLSHVGHPHAEMYIDLITHAYADIGVAVRTMEMPLQRRFLALQKGLVDGDVAARQGIDASFSNILKVEPALTDMQVVLLCRKPLPCDSDIPSDPTVDLYVDSGVLTALEADNVLRRHARMVLLDRTEATLELLRLGRIDYMLLSLDIHQALPAAIAREVSQISLARIAVYHYVHSRHRDLLPQLSHAIARRLNPQSGAEEE